MATENTSPKSNSKNDSDGPTIEVKEETLAESSISPKEASASAGAKKEEPKPAAAKDSPKTNSVKQDAKSAAAPKEEAKPAVKEEAKPAAAAAKAETKAAVKEETKSAATNAAPKEEVKPVVKDEAKPAAAAPKQEVKPAVKEDPKPAATTAAPKEDAKKEEPKAEAKPAASAPPPATPKPPSPKPPPAVDTVSRVGRAEAIVRRNVLWSLGAGVVPFPIFDAVAISGVQIKMLAELSELYKVAFTESVAKKIIGSLLSGIGGVAIGSIVGSSLVKLVPGVGTALGIVSVPLIGGAATNATGKIFIMHFESGGTLLDFDPHKMRSYFRQEFEKSRQVVADMNKNEQAKTNKG